MQTIKQFWAKAPISVKASFIFIGLVIFSVIMLGFIYPIVGLAILFVAGIVGLVFAIAAVISFIEDYRYKNY